MHFIESGRIRFPLVQMQSWQNGVKGFTVTDLQLVMLRGVEVILDLCQLLNTVIRTSKSTTGLVCGSCMYDYLNMCAHLFRPWQRSPDLHTI